MTNAYIKLSTQEYPRHVGDIEIDPAGIEDYAQVSWYDPPYYDTAKQLCYETTPINVNEIWIMKWITRDKTQEEIDLDNKTADKKVFK
jgi:hypothetical protein